MQAFTLPGAHQQDENLPWECRDLQAQADSTHNTLVRKQRDELATENMRLKRLLRQTGIAWSDIARAHINDSNGATQTPANQKCSKPGSLPYLPAEVLFLILRYAVVSPKPILDPLLKRRPETLTAEERDCGNQVAMGFLSTSRAFHYEGTRIFWSQNAFTFTSPDALRSFGEMDISIRTFIKHINLRIIAQYYDDQDLSRTIPSTYHHSLQRSMPLPTNARSSDITVERGGFRCYTWYQMTDFLRALRAPFDSDIYSKIACPRMFPCLRSMRMDLVNFLPHSLHYTGPEFHDIAAHELAYMLDELQITGLPSNDPGFKAGAELTGLLRDGGVLLTSSPTYIQDRSGLQFLEGKSLVPRMIRSWRIKDSAPLSVPIRGSASAAAAGAAAAGKSGKKKEVEAAALKIEEASHDVSRQVQIKTDHLSLCDKEKDKLVVWRYIPETRDGTVRKWVPFSKTTGYAQDTGEHESLLLSDQDSDVEPEDGLDTSWSYITCSECGGNHPGACFMVQQQDLSNFQNITADDLATFLSPQFDY